MKTRFISIGIILLLSASLGLAQSTERAKTSFAILGGAGFQNFNGKDYSGDKLKNTMILGYHAGINVQIPIVPEFYFQPGLLFSTKGSKKSGVILTNTYKLSYIELPLNFVYKGLLGNGYILVGFGPYIGYAIGGKVITTGGSGSLETKIVFKNVVELGDPLLVHYFKALDAGGNIFAGYEMANGIFIQLNTQLGMLNIKPEDKLLPGSKATVRNTSYGISLGYRF
jgi:Outer membrane protein beta-barrel domain